MCIRDSLEAAFKQVDAKDLGLALDSLYDLGTPLAVEVTRACLLYTSDAADERSSVDLGGRRIIKKKTEI